MNDYLTGALDLFVRNMKQRRLSEKTIKSYVSVVMNLAKVDSRIYRLSNYQIQSFILESNSHSALNVKINALKKFFKINHPDRRIKVFIRPKRAKKMIEILSVDEVWQILDSITHVKQKAMIAGIYLHGLRVSEILNLKYSKIDRSRKLLFIEQGKGKKDRLVPLNDLWLNYLANYARQQKHGKGYDKPIFAPYSASSIRNVLNEKARECGIVKNVYPHLLRDCYASHLLEQGVDTRFIQEILGHENLATTQKYLHVSAVNISTISLKVVHVKKAS